MSLLLILLEAARRRSPALLEDAPKDLPKDAAPVPEGANTESSKKGDLHQWQGLMKTAQGLKKLQLRRAVAAGARSNYSSVERQETRCSRIIARS